MRFTKMHGIGNDYVYVDCFQDKFPGDPGELFARYLQSVQQMIKFVDGLEGKS